MGVTSFALRVRWHRRALGRNQLIRVSDRLESLSVLAVLLTAFLGVPLAAYAGSLVYGAGMGHVHEQAHSRHSVETVVVEGSTVMPADFDSSASVRVQWGDGTALRTEQVTSPALVKAGAPLKIWLDDKGRVVPAPSTEFDAEVTAGAVAWTVWGAVVACSALVALVMRRGLDRSRARDWERELQLLAHNDDGWANRYT